jgi:predicted hotdog family 3-hydroxylacyl-ACP dehydratase
VIPLPGNRDAIAALMPHAGAMVLLDRTLSCDAAGIVCAAKSHLDPANPLRREAGLSAVCGLEYALQAAALHGALTDGTPHPAGYVASLRDVVLLADRLDDPALGELRVTARLERQEAGGLIYALAVETADGRALLSGRAAIALPARTCG